MTEWFYAREGRQHGPITFEQLVELAGNGGLDPVCDSVWNASMQGWTPAGQLPGLFNPASAPPVPPVGLSNPYAAPQSNWTQSIDSSGDALSEISPGSEQIDPVVCISRGFELAKRQFGNILLLGLVYFCCLIGVAMVFGVFEALPGILASKGSENTGGASNLSIFVLVISRIVQQVFSVFLQLGLARAGLNLISGKEVSVGLLFGEGSKLLRAIGASIIFGIAVVIGLLLLIVPGIYIALRYGQFINAIVDRDLGIMEAFSYSESITTNNRMNLFLLGLLSMLVVFAGLLLCGVGLIFAGPVVWLAALVAYRWLQYGSDAAKDHPGTEIPVLKGI